MKNAVKRKLIQIAAFGFTNFHIGNFAGGKLYTGKFLSSRHARMSHWRHAGSHRFHTVSF